jgi:hypothetical protein
VRKASLVLRDNPMINAMSNRYREVRRQVYERATELVTRDKHRLTDNKALFRNAVAALYNGASLGRYSATTFEARTALWYHLWKPWNAILVHKATDVQTGDRLGTTNRS